MDVVRSAFRSREKMLDLMQSRRAAERKPQAVLRPSAALLRLVYGLFAFVAFSLRRCAFA
jgi:hypothetical protein